MKQLYTMVALAATTFSFAQANLPFSFSGGAAAIAQTEGLSQTGLGGDYSANPKLKFDSSGDYVILHFNQTPETLSFDIKHNQGSMLWAATSNVYSVLGSTDGVEYTYNIAIYNSTNILTANSETKTMEIPSDVRYIKWVYTTKGNNGGNVGLGNLQLTEGVATAPQLTASVTSLTDFVYTEGEGPSASQSFDLSGTDTNGTDVTVTAPAQFEVSTDNTTFATTATLAAYNGDSTPIYVRLAAGAEVGTYNGNVTIAGAGTTTALEVQVSGEVEEVILPVLAASVTSLEDFVYTEGEGPSASQSFDLSGTDTNGTDVTVTAPAQFEVSTDNTTFAATATLAAYNGDSTPIYVRLAAGAEVGTYEGDLTISGNNSNEVTVSLSGDVTESASTKDHTIDGLSMYPNPATHQISIVSNAIGTKQVMIFDIVGKKVMETTTTETVNVSGLRSGMYLVKVTQDGKSATIKLVIK